VRLVFFINFHLFSVDQCVFLIFHESYSYLMNFCAAWVTLKLWRGVFSYNFGMENLMVQMVPFFCLDHFVFTRCHDQQWKTVFINNKEFTHKVMIICSMNNAIWKTISSNGSVRWLIWNMWCYACCLNQLILARE